MTAPTKCSGPAGPYCAIMEQRLDADADAEGPTHRGLRELILTSFKDGTRRKAGIYHKAGRDDDGLMLNFCCWCGAEIRYQETKEKAGDE